MAKLFALHIIVIVVYLVFVEWFCPGIVASGG